MILTFLGMIAIAVLASLFLYFIIALSGVDTVKETLPENCTYDGDCPCCENTTIMWQNKEETEIRYWCKNCDWQVAFHKEPDGLWRKEVYD